MIPESVQFNQTSSFQHQAIYTFWSERNALFKIRQCFLNMDRYDCPMGLFTSFLRHNKNRSYSWVTPSQLVTGLLDEHVDVKLLQHGVGLVAHKFASVLKYVALEVLLYK